MLIALALAGCRSHRDARTLPTVQPSSPNPPTGFVTVTAELSFAPGCVVITPGETVEWKTRAPEIPVNVTSIGEPMELFSPNLQPPLGCTTPDGDPCWRHTFERAGCFEYFDTNSGSPGRAVRDPYYGTVKYVGQSGDVTRGVVCVDASRRCTGICCVTNADCPSEPPGRFKCEAQRCVEVASGRAVPCAERAPASAPAPEPRDGG